MATVTYSWNTVVLPFFMNNAIPGGVQFQPAIAGLANGSYFGAWTTPATSVQGRIIGSNGTPVTDQFQLNTTVDLDQADASVAGLIGGGAVVTFTDTSGDLGGDIRARRFNADGSAVDILDFGVELTSNDDFASDVAGLSDGGFVVSWTRTFGFGTDEDIRAKVFNSDGSARSDVLIVDGFVNLNTRGSSVAGLAGGGFVVAWEQAPVGGTVSDLYFRRYDASGNALDATSRAIDGSPFSQSDVQIAALPDGGFVAAYIDYNWFLHDSTEITARVFNADGSPRTTYLLVNSTTAGNQLFPTLTVLSNGFFVVGWLDSSTGLSWQQAYTPDGLAVGPNFGTQDQAVETEIAALTGGLVASVYRSTVADGGGDDSIRSRINELTRTTTGDATNETLTGDSLPDTINGLGGADVMSGAGGNDTYVVDNAGDAVVELVNNGNDTVRSSVNYALPANVEILFLTSTADLQGYGNGLNNTLNGNGGNNLLDSGAGADIMAGQTGNDTYFVDHASDLPLEQTNAGNDTIFAAISFTLPGNVENLILQGGADLQGYAATRRTCSTATAATTCSTAPAAST
jgi:Ca2+-binding RTX toxin-like protein